MKYKFDGIIMLFVAMTIGIVMVSSVVLPQVFASTERTLMVDVNTTDFSPINSTGGNINVSFTTNYVYTTAGCNISIAYNHNYTPNYTQFTYSDGTNISNMTAATNNASNVSTIAISSAYLNASTNGNGDVIQRFNFTTNAATTEVNVTDQNLTCVYKNAQERQGWDAGSTAIWGILGLVIVAVLILFIFGGRAGM